MNKVAKINDLVASTDQLPSHLKAVEGVGRGNEDVGMNVQIPRISLLQTMSPEVDKNHVSFIEGAEPGLLLNKLSGELSKEIYVLSLQFKVEFVAWKKREAGGGFKGNFPTREAAEASLQEQKEKLEQYDITENHAHLLIVKNPTTGDLDHAPCIMDFASSKIRVSKSWNSQIALKGGDRFAGLWKIAGMPTQNKQGQTFHNLDVSFVGWAQEEDYKAAEEMFEAYQNVKTS